MPDSENTIVDGSRPGIWNLNHYGRVMQGHGHGGNDRGMTERPAIATGDGDGGPVRPGSTGIQIEVPNVPVSDRHVHWHGDRDRPGPSAAVARGPRRPRRERST